MNCFAQMFDFLNNASVAAFFGAFFAYFLVVLTDWRRKRKRVALIKIRLSVNHQLAINKKELAATNIGLIQENKFISAPIMKFPTEDVRFLLREALDVLSQNQINAVDALIYWMEAIDGLFSRATICAEQLKELGKTDAPNTVRSAKGNELL